MAEVTRLELATSCVTGKHSNQLSYTSINGGHNWARTSDPLLVRQVLSQLSYATRKKCVKTQNGWAGWIRTNASWSQSPLPYRLATAHQDNIYNIIFFLFCQIFFEILKFINESINLMEDGIIFEQILEFL